jgi:hypothetical protein
MIYINNDIHLSQKTMSLLLDRFDTLICKTQHNQQISQVGGGYKGNPATPIEKINPIKIIENAKKLGYVES